MSSKFLVNLAIVSSLGMVSATTWEVLKGVDNLQGAFEFCCAHLHSF